jgi:uncharacterized OB-fold protein
MGEHKLNKPQQNRLEQEQNRKKRVRCLTCGTYQKEYLNMGQMGLPFFICMNCGNVFVPPGTLKQMVEHTSKTIKEPGRIVMPGSANVRKLN